MKDLGKRDGELVRVVGGRGESVLGDGEDACCAGRKRKKRSRGVAARLRRLAWRWLKVSSIYLSIYLYKYIYDCTGDGEDTCGAGREREECARGVAA